MTREEKIIFCKECVHILKDYYYVQWDVMEDYQIDNWYVYFKKLQRNNEIGNVVPFKRR